MPDVRDDRSSTTPPSKTTTSYVVPGRALRSAEPARCRYSAFDTGSSEKNTRMPIADRGAQAGIVLRTSPATRTSSAQVRGLKSTSSVFDRMKNKGLSQSFLVAGATVPGAWGGGTVG